VRDPISVGIDPVRDEIPPVFCAVGNTIDVVSNIVSVRDEIWQSSQFNLKKSKIMYTLLHDTYKNQDKSSLQQVLLGIQIMEKWFHRGLLNLCIVVPKRLVQ